jgi:hypothetical protein
MALLGWPRTAARAHTRSRPGACATAAATLTMATFGAAGELGEGAAMEEEGGDYSSP